MLGVVTASRLSTTLGCKETSGRLCLPRYWYNWVSEAGGGSCCSPGHWLCSCWREPFQSSSCVCRSRMSPRKLPVLVPWVNLAGSRCSGMEAARWACAALWFPPAYVDLW